MRILNLIWLATVRKPPSPCPETDAAQCSLAMSQCDSTYLGLLDIESHLDSFFGNRSLQRIEDFSASYLPVSRGSLRCPSKNSPPPNPPLLNFLRIPLQRLSSGPVGRQAHLLSPERPGVTGVQSTVYKFARQTLWLGV